MADLSGSQPSGPTQSSLFNPGEPPPPQEGVLAARNAEETFVWVMRLRGGNTQQKGQTMDYRCKYCGVNFSGAGPQTIRAHFQVAYPVTETLPTRDPCRKATPAIREEIRQTLVAAGTPRTGSKSKATQQAKKAAGAVGAAGGGGGQKVNSFKQSTLDDQASQQRKACTEDANVSVAHFLAECGVAPNVVGHPAFKTMVSKIRDAPDYKPPNRHEFSMKNGQLGKYTQLALDGVNRDRDKLLKRQTTGGTMSADGAKVLKRNTLLTTLTLASVGTYEKLLIFHAAGQ